MNSSQIADRIFEKNADQEAFWREFFQADAEGRVTREMRHRGEQLLRQQDLRVTRFLNSLASSRQLKTTGR